VSVPGLRRALYSLLLFALLPAALLHLVWRARRQPEYLRHVGERLGCSGGRAVSPAAGARPLIWIHAVSVGETRAAAPLVEALLARYPGHRILLTHTTPTGRAAGQQLFGERVMRAYLPWDLPFVVNAFLGHHRPVAGLLMETEIWFNLAAACQRRGLPLLLVNARLSERSARGYGRLAGLTAVALRSLAAVAAQTPADAARLEALGAVAPVVTGNLKFDVTPPPAQLALGAQLRARFGATRPVLLAASTREGEEPLVLDAFAALNVPGALLVLVPRHPQRFDEVEQLVLARGWRCARRSAEEPVAGDVAVVLGDSMGEMFAYYASSDVAFVGGSLLPLGGQNLIEAAATGCPVLTGPHTFNFADASRLAVASGAARVVHDPAELADAARQLLTDAAARARMGEAALAFAAAHGGATARTLSLIVSKVPALR
jgi:3-deoxy-D-manno-octulosonic-acid transferase